MAAFSRGDYVRALEQDTMAQTISKVLYPADDHISGKRLRLQQQYLLVSASLQSILSVHYKQYKTFRNLPDKVSIHINDTHPALCVPELMRILVDENDYDWEEAWDITCRTLSYTNHTVMSEALERWSVDLFREQLPRIYSITAEINRRLMIDLQKVYPATGASSTIWPSSPTTRCAWPICAWPAATRLTASPLCTPRFSSRASSGITMCWTTTASPT